MLAGFDMTMCPNLAVSAEVMQHVVQVESGANPFAIGVVGGQLVRQPANFDEAVATVKMLDAQGYDYSLGVAQVNRRNLQRYGLDTYAKAFDPCGNLQAGATILAECYGRSGQDWGKAFSCYYSGDFTTGYRDGYVQKVYASIQADRPPGTPEPAAAIPLKAIAVPPRTVVAVVPPIGTPGYRAALRSTAIDSVANAAVSAIAGAVSRHDAAPPASADPAAEPPVQQAPARSGPQVASADVFEPVVRGPNDPASPPAAATSPIAAAPAADHADLRQEQRDAAFVF